MSFFFSLMPPGTPVLKASGFNEEVLGGTPTIGAEFWFSFLIRFVALYDWLACIS